MTTRLDLKVCVVLLMLLLITLVKEQVDNWLLLNVKLDC
jgi:hypothetical protein